MQIFRNGIEYRTEKSGQNKTVKERTNLEKGRINGFGCSIFQFIENQLLYIILLVNLGIIPDHFFFKFKS